MQHKQRRAKTKGFLTLLVLLLIGGAGVLMTVNVPPPQNPVEKPLDSKVFLESKQQ